MSDQPLNPPPPVAVQANPDDPSACKHLRFGVSANVNRVQLLNGEIGSYLLSVSANCTVCGKPFWFPGLPTGVSHAEPTTNPDGFILTTPIVPANAKCQPDATLASTLVRSHDAHKGIKR